MGIFIPKPESIINVGTTFKIFFTQNNNNSIKINKNSKIIEECNSSSISSIITVNLNICNLEKKNFHINNEKQIIHILICDDSQFNLNSLESYLKKNLISHNFEIVIKKSSNFFEFLNEINSLLYLGQFFNFLILDYNIECNINGINIAKCAIDVYKNSKPDFNENKMNIFFYTEENNFYENNRNNFFVKRNQIFNKFSLFKLKEKIEEKLINININ